MCFGPEYTPCSNWRKSPSRKISNFILSLLDKIEVENPNPTSPKFTRRAFVHQFAIAFVGWRVFKNDPVPEAIPHNKKAIVWYTTNSRQLQKMGSSCVVDIDVSGSIPMRDLTRQQPHRDPDLYRPLKPDRFFDCMTKHHRLNAGKMICARLVIADVVESRSSNRTESWRFEPTRTVERVIEKAISTTVRVVDFFETDEKAQDFVKATIKSLHMTNESLLNESGTSSIVQFRGKWDFALAHSEASSQVVWNFIIYPGETDPPIVPVLGGMSTEDEDQLDQLIMNRNHPRALRSIASGNWTHTAVQYLHDIYQQWATNRRVIATKLKSGLAVSANDVMANCELCQMYTHQSNQLSMIT